MSFVRICSTNYNSQAFINDAGGKVENEDRCRLARGVRRASSLILQGVTPDDCKQFVQELLDLLGKDIRIRKSY